VTLADCTVMVVEDHEFQRRTTLQILANLGAGGLLEAADGEGALALLGADPRPDIVVCDLDMPGMDGVEFLRQVAALGAGTAVDELDGELQAVVLHLVAVLGAPAEVFAALNRTLVNAGVTKIAIGATGTNVLTVNDHSHLELAGRELVTYR